MNPSKKCIDLVKKFEGCRLHAYQDIASIWTIGYGSTMYQDGTKIKPGDTITQEQADELLMWELTIKAGSASAFVQGNVINQNMFDALCSFAFNVGVGALQKSTLLKLIRQNPRDAKITDAFLMWNKAKIKGVMTAVDGLTRRRRSEAALYFTEI